MANNAIDSVFWAPTSSVVHSGHLPFFRRLFPLPLQLLLLPLLLLANKRLPRALRGTARDWPGFGVQESMSNYDA